jgi:hypothetical protein
MTTKSLLHGLNNRDWKPILIENDGVLKVRLTNPTAGSGNISINEPLPVATESEEAEDEQMVFCKWVNDKVPGAAETILTDAGLVLNLVAGRVYKISQICMELTTASDEVVFELGYTDEPNGAGTFTPVGPKEVYATGVGFTGFSGVTLTYTPAIPFVYEENVKESVTLRVDCNDAGATITPGFHGYYKEI